MCVVETAHLLPAVRADAVQIILSDHHYWGGLRRTKDLAAICEAVGIGVSMHSNSHLGVSPPPHRRRGATERRGRGRRLVG